MYLPYSTIEVIPSIARSNAGADPNSDSWKYPDEGHILVDGKEVTIRSPKDSHALGIGMVHQHFKLVDVLTAAENIVLGLPGKAMLNMKKITEEIWMVNRLVQCGVNAVILKSSAHAELVAAIRSVLRGESYTCPRFASILKS